MTRQLINSDRLHHDVPYHNAAAATGEALIFTAGACPLDGDGHVVAPGDIPSQTRQALENLHIAIRATLLRRPCSLRLLRGTTCCRPVPRDAAMATRRNIAAVHCKRPTSKRTLSGAVRRTVCLPRARHRRHGTAVRPVSLAS